MAPKEETLSTQIYIGTFVKADGSTRNMRFRRLSENFTAERSGRETVWDEEVQGFRKFNWGTAKGKVQII